VSIVAQEPVLFAESILYNITFGVQDPDSVPLAQVRPVFEGIAQGIASSHGAQVIIEHLLAAVSVCRLLSSHVTKACSSGHHESHQFASSQQKVLSK
jgi:ABC-type multidrug transport system fused ATPase/permease subunit